MKILKLCYEFPPLGGGGGRVVHGLGRELARSGHDVTLVTMGFHGLPARESVDGIDVHRVPGIRQRPYQCSIPEVACHLPMAARVARRLHEQRHFDIVHAHFILPDGFNAWRLHRDSNLPYVITAHGSDVPGYDTHRLRLAHSLLSSRWRSITGAADTITCPSDTLAGLIRDRTPDSRVEVIPNGLDLGVRDSRGKRRKQILVVSKILERKGIQYFVRAIAAMKSDFEAHIVGDGPYMPEIRRLVTETGAAVRLWGWLDNQSPELANLYATSGIFVLPSEAENFPVVLLEAMRASLAIVTTRGTGCAEVVGDAAMLVDPGNVEQLRVALSELTANESLCDTLGAASRLRIEARFGQAAIARRYVGLYEACLQRTMQRAGVPGRDATGTEPRGNHVS